MDYIIDYSQIEKRLEEEELQEVYAYLERHKEKIIIRLYEVNEEIVLIPTKAVIKDSKGFLIEEFQTFGLTKQNDNKITVELIK